MFQEHNTLNDVSNIEIEEPDDVLVRFYKDYNEMCQINFQSSERAYNIMKYLANYYITDDKVKKDPHYIDIWLQLATHIIDEEEIYVYMYNTGIGDKDKRLYERWLQWYIDNKMFILADQLLQQANKRIILSHSDNGVLDLKEKLRGAIINALVDDFYKQPFYDSHVSKESQGITLGEEDGISLTDYESIKSIDLTTRINDVVGNIYCTSLFEREKNIDQHPVKRKSFPNLEQVTMRKGKQMRKKYSDLINMKQYSKGAIYIEKDCRDIIPQVTLLAYEYEYLTKKYKDHVPERHRNNNYDDKWVFWIKEEKQKEMRQLNIGRKIIRVKPKYSRISHGSGIKKKISKNSSTKRSANRHSSSKKENTAGYSNRQDQIASIPKFIGLDDLGDTFECKRYSDGIFSQQATNTHLSNTSRSFLNMAFNMRIMETPFSMFNNDSSHTKTLKMRTVDVKDNICKELPRYDSYQEYTFN